VIVIVKIDVERGTASASVSRRPQVRKRGRPLDKERHLTLTATKPWEAQGISERTWYRRQKEGGA
jgi:hypothetical protein